MNTSIVIIGAAAVVAVFIVLFIIVLIRRRQVTSTNPTSASKLAANLRNEKLKSDIILNAIEDGVVLVDDQHVIQSFNPGAVHISGWTIDEAEGLDFNSVLKFVNEKDEPYTDRHNPFNRAYKDAQTIRDNQAILVSKAGKHVMLSLSVTPLLDEHKQVRGVVAVFRDVSQERQEEQQRAEFISTASHEMRTPVAAIEGYLSLALNDKVSTIDARARDYLEKAHSSTRHLGDLFQDLLTSAKAEDGRLTSHPVVVEMGAFLDHLVQDLRFAAEKKGLPVDLIVGSHTQGVAASIGLTKTIRPLYYVHADPDRIREVITNLFDNAVKYTDSGKIALGLTGNDNVVQFFVQDTGPGIPREDQPHLFQKFYRVDNSATRTIGGTGLGLFICRKIIELYDGRIWVESEVGKGSTFYMNLPRLTPQEVEEIQKTALTTAGYNPADANPLGVDGTAV